MRKPALLFVALCSLALFFGWKARSAWLAPPPSVDDTGRASAEIWRPGAPMPDPPPPPESAGAVSAIVARPLFRADRRLFREKDPGAEAGRNYEAELSRLSLIGTLAFGGEMKGIVVGKGSPNAERWEVKAGDPLPGFKVKEVQIDSLTVTADGREFSLPLYAGPPTAAAGPVRTETRRKEPAPAPPAASAPPPSAAPPPVAQPPSTVPPPRPVPTITPERSPGRPPRFYPRR